MLELRINGFGGQGSVTLAHLLAQAALENGQQGQALPFFGVERRGAPVRAAVRISPTTIHAHSQCELPDYLVVMSEKLTQAAVNEGINNVGTVIVNSPQAISVSNHPTWQVDADAIARDAGLFSAYLDGFIDREGMIEEIKRQTRRFAKRQLTWFKKDKRIYWVEVGHSCQKEIIIEKIVSYIEGQLYRV
jgi:2-oxoacid:acceptor oxidoreductase gamma subunit (pyruvate/2-ketoisovalerate family)